MEPIHNAFFVTKQVRGEPRVRGRVRDRLGQVEVNDRHRHAASGPHPDLSHHHARVASVAHMCREKSRGSPRAQEGKEYDKAG